MFYLTEFGHTRLENLEERMERVPRISFDEEGDYQILNSIEKGTDNLTDLTSKLDMNSFEVSRRLNNLLEGKQIERRN